MMLVVVAVNLFMSDLFLSISLLLPPSLSLICTSFSPYPISLSLAPPSLSLCPLSSLPLVFSCSPYFSPSLSTQTILKRQKRNTIDPLPFQDIQLQCYKAREQTFDFVLSLRLLHTHVNPFAGVSL